MTVLTFVFRPGPPILPIMNDGVVDGGEDDSTRVIGDVDVDGEEDGVILEVVGENGRVVMNVGDEVGGEVGDEVILCSHYVGMAV